MELDGVGGEVADQDVEDLIEGVGGKADEGRLLADQLAVGDQREQLAEGQQVVEVLLLLLAGRRVDEQLS